MRRKDLQIGQTITFGHYMMESKIILPIKWEILDVDNKNLLLISKTILDIQPFQRKWEDVTWENCDLRHWLNKTFFSRAFNYRDRKRIVETSVDSGRDKIFILSAEEAVKYLCMTKDSNGNYYSENAVGQPTKYACSLGAYSKTVVKDWCGFKKYKYSELFLNKTVGWWWLRTPGYRQSNVMYVYDDGSIDATGLGNSRDYVGVRPALWITLE